jgi:polyphosphate kinase 2 (PPK2 family)
MGARLKALDLSRQLKDKREYERKLKDAQLGLLHLERKVIEGKTKIVIGFEGWDAAGKGGCIKRIAERLDPRGLRVYPIGVPTDEEKAHHYLWRFWTRMPADGQICVFDRTWYGRVLVERVEGLAKRREWTRAYREINDFERQLADGGTILIKFWLHISKEEQLRRFRERERNPFKRWKITPADWRNRDKWDDYAKAAEDMFEATDTKNAPWTLVEAERKWYARVKVVETIAERVRKAL